MNKEQLWKELHTDQSDEAKLVRYLIEEKDCDPVVSKLVARYYRRLEIESSKLN